MFNKLILSICLLTVLISCNNKSRQDNAKNIIVISKEQFRFAADTTNGRPFPDFDFTMTRTNYSDSSFTDGPLICSDDTSNDCKLTFNVVNGFWYVKTDDDWQEFYSPVDSLLKVVYFKKQKFILKPIGENRFYNNKKLLGLAKEDLYVYSPHENILFFHQDFGIVAIGRQQLIRTDFKIKSK